MSGVDAHHRNNHPKRGRDDGVGDGKGESSNKNKNNQRRKILLEREDWGLKEVLAECGLIDFASSSSSSSFAPPPPPAPHVDASEQRRIGCRLDTDVSSSTVRSSLFALLRELSTNAVDGDAGGTIDPRNERILKDLEDVIANNGFIYDNNNTGGNNNNNNNNNSRCSLRRMLLPMYRIRTTTVASSAKADDNVTLSQRYFELSQFSQSPEDNDHVLVVEQGSSPGASMTDKRRRTKVIMESSSLIRILLGVDVLQSTLIAGLLRKLTEIASSFSFASNNNNNNNNDDGNTSSNDNDEEDVPRLILSNIRWLDHIVDYTTLTESFVECLTVLASMSASCDRTRGILLDVIGTLPDILGDSNNLCFSSSNGRTTSTKKKKEEGENDAIEEDNDEDDSYPILATLQHLRTQDPSLLIPCLDAIGTFNLSPEQNVRVVRDALEALSNVDVDDDDSGGLPALTTFLMNYCPTTKGGGSTMGGGGRSMTKDVIEEMRKLPLGGGPLSSSVTAASSCLVIESLSRGFAHRQDMTMTLLKCIKETPPGDHPTTDIWLLACCASAPHNRSKVLSLVKSKAIAGEFTSRMMRESLSGNGIALTSLFGTSLCELADGLLRCPSSSSLSSDSSMGGGGGAACDLGVTLYEILFEEFHEPMQRQEVVGSLVTHVGSGVSVKSGEVDAALRVFCGIVDKTDGTAALRPFTPFLTSMLDHLHNMTPSQIRRLFLLLFAVGGNDEEGGDGNNRASDDVHIVIRKHLSLTPFAMKRIGIIGTVAYAVSRSSQLLERHTIIDGIGSAAFASSPVIKEITDVINSAYTHCKPSGTSSGSAGNANARNVTTSSLGRAFSEGSSMAFLLEELCHAVCGGKLAKGVLEWIEELIRADFEDTFVGDFVDTASESAHGKVAEGDAPVTEMIPTCSVDLALLDGTSENTIAPPGEMRFDARSCDDPLVYIKILPFLASYNITEREIMPVYLSAMFRLIALVTEVDALLGCPILLPASSSSGIEFEDLGATKQWVATSSYYFAACLIRQLINSFIQYAADESASLPGSILPPAGSYTSSSQGLDYTKIQKQIVARLRALVELDEELRFTSSKCYTFAPPGLDVLPPPRELVSINHTTIIGENAANANLDGPKTKAKEEKKALTAAKNRAFKLKKVKQNYEQKLVHRSFDALRALDPNVCLALGFTDLCVVSSEDDEMHFTKCGDKVTTMLLKLLQKTLSESLFEKKSMAFKARMDGSSSVEEDMLSDNPYMSASPVSNKASTFDEIALACESYNSKKSYELLDRLLRGDVFVSIHEHLAAVAELRCGSNKSNDAESESQLIETARCLFRCLQSIVSSEMLTRSVTGRAFLVSILIQIKDGNRKSYGSDTRRRRVSSTTMNKLLDSITDNVNEIVSGAWTNDLCFAMDGVNCMQVIYECSRRMSVSVEEMDNDSDDYASSISIKLSTTADKLLRQHWSDDTKMNKENVGRLLSLVIKHSSDRMKAMTHLVTDVLAEVPFLDKGSSVAIFPTCSRMTFPCFYATVMQFLWKELVRLFDSLLGKTKDPIAALPVLESMKDMIVLLQQLFDLTKELDAKKTTLLQQLKFGSRFIETFVVKAIPFCQVHFTSHQDSIIEIIRLLQKCSHRLNHIISHGKREKDAHISKEAPRAKKVLETFIHKVKAMLKKNHCMTALITKALKEKDIDGTTFKEGNDGSKDEDDDGEEDEGESSDDDGGEEENDSDESGGQSAEDSENSENEYDTDDD